MESASVRLVVLVAVVVVRDRSLPAQSTVGRSNADADYYGTAGSHDVGAAADDGAHVLAVECCSLNSATWVQSLSPAVRLSHPSSY